jgi:hypothetical protein
VSPVDVKTNPVVLEAAPYTPPTVSVFSAPDLLLMAFVNVWGVDGVWSTPAGMAPTESTGVLAVFTRTLTETGPTTAVTTTPPLNACGAVNVFAFRGP